MDKPSIVFFLVQQAFLQQDDLHTKVQWLPTWENYDSRPRVRFWEKWHGLACSPCLLRCLGCCILRHLLSHLILFKIHLAVSAHEQENSLHPGHKGQRFSGLSRTCKTLAACLSCRSFLFFLRSRSVASVVVAHCVCLHRFQNPNNLSRRDQLIEGMFEGQFSPPPSLIWKPNRLLNATLVLVFVRNLYQSASTLTCQVKHLQ